MSAQAIMGEAQGPAVLRLLRCEDIGLVSREMGVTAATLSQWLDAFLEAGESGLSSSQ